MRAFEITQRAGELVARDRHDQHGEMLANHQAIADIWNGYLRAASIAVHDLTAADVANMMELLKVARRLNGAFNPDDYVDGAGYAAIAGEIASRLRNAAPLNEPSASAKSSPPHRDLAQQPILVVSSLPQHGGIFPESPPGNVPFVSH